MTVWALIEYTDPNGVRHPIGEEFELSTATEAEQHAAGKLLRYGILTEQAPVGIDPGVPSGRTRRR